MTNRPNPELGIHLRQDTGGVKDAFEEVERHRYANIGGSTPRERYADISADRRPLVIANPIATGIRFDREGGASAEASR